MTNTAGATRDCEWYAGRAAEALRDDPRFMDLMKDIGLVGYWNATGTEPDPFLFTQ